MGGFAAAFIASNLAVVVLVYTDSVAFDPSASTLLQLLILPTRISVWFLATISFIQQPLLRRQFRGLVLDAEDIGEDFAALTLAQRLASRRSFDGDDGTSR